MQIHILGAQSFLAQAFIQELKGHSLHFYSRSKPAFASLGTWHCYNYPRQPLDYAQLAQAEAIYYFAGAGIQPGHGQSEALQWQLNYFQPQQLLTALQEHGYRGLWRSFGSYFEWGKGHLAPDTYFDVEALCRHKHEFPNSYCASKSALSRLFHAAAQCSIYSFSWQHFILGNVYGAGENPKRLLPYMLQQIQKGEILQFTAGTQLRQYSHAGDLAAFLAKYVQSEAQGIFPLLGSACHSVRQVIELFAQEAQKRALQVPPMHFAQAERNDTAMQRLALSPLLLEQTFGEALTERSLEQGLAGYFSL